jgi:hypothetical protein
MSTSYYAHVVLGIKVEDLSLVEITSLHEAKRFNVLTGEPYFLTSPSTDLYSGSKELAYTPEQPKTIKNCTVRQFLAQINSEENDEVFSEDFHKNKPRLFSRSYLSDMQDHQLHTDIVLGYGVADVNSWSYGDSISSFDLNNSHIQTLATWLFKHLEFPIPKTFALAKPYLVLKVSY